MRTNNLIIDLYLIDCRNFNFCSQLNIKVRGLIRNMYILKFICYTIDRFVSWIAKVFGTIIIFPMIFATVYDVILRYFSNNSTVWAYDFTWMSYAAFFLIGASYCLQDDGHVRVDTFYNRFPERTRAYLECLILLIFLFPLLYVVLRYSIPWAYKSWVRLERSQYTMWRPYLFPIKSILPISFILLALQAISNFIKNIVFAIKGVKL
jgi:TRAP-type mannitol/chloroaromatic compound transport system permease small subunit